MVTLKSAYLILAGSSGQREFAADFHSFDERLRSTLGRTQVFDGVWDRWTASRQPFQRSDGAQVIAVEKPAGEFFNLVTWERRLAMHWYRALPNYLVGLGLCFTFLGVVAVISIAAASLQSSKEAADQTEALRQLLEAASFKFVTSLVGVFASVCYSLFFRWRLINVERGIATLVVELSRRIFTLNPTALLLQIREENQRQTGCLETMATNVGVAVGEQFTKATRVMGDALAQLDATVKAMSDKMGEKTDSMKQAIDGLSGGIVETTSKDLEKLVASAVEALNTTLKDHLDAIAVALKETCREIEGTRAAFSEVAGHAGEVRAEYATLAGEIRARTEEVSELLLKAEGEVEAKLRGAVDAAEKIELAIGKAAENAAGMESLGDGLSKAAETVHGAADTWRAMGEDFGKFTLANEDASETVKAAVESLRVQWETQGSRIGEIDTHLATTIGTVQTHFDGYALRLREYTAELDSQLGRAVGSFSATVEAFGDAPQRFEDAGEQLKKAAQNAVDALEPLRKLDALAAALTKSADALRAAIPPSPDTLP